MKQAKFVRGLSMALALILLCAAVPLGTLAAGTATVELVDTDVTLDETHFEYTGEEIRPNVTVRVKDQLLTLDRDYTLAYKDNVEIGIAAVVVTGIAANGYTGTVELPFYIDPKTSGDSQPDQITIIASDVLIDGTEFMYTGEAVEPAVTVTVAGKELTAGEDYTLVYENNIQPGIASVTVTGVADKGYTGSVTIHFTIQVVTGSPSEPEETQPEQTQPEETEPATYRITQGNGAVWNKDSGKDLSFTADGAFQDFISVQVDGKTVSSKYYTVQEGSTVVTLKESFLQHLELGKYTITIKFTDGTAEGAFKISAPVDESNPKTGDDFALHSWAALLFVSLTAISGTAFAFRKKIWK